MLTILKWGAAGLVLIWLVFGSPLSTAANLFWKEGPAPWETIDAYYYPDRYDLSVDISRLDVSSIRACRDWVYATAATKGDPNLERGDYECAIGCRPKDGLNICRLTVD